VVEFLLFKNWSQGTNKELELGGKTYTLTQLFLFGNKLLTECCRLVTEMTKDFSFDIKYGSGDEGRDTSEIPDFTLGTKR